MIALGVPLLAAFSLWGNLQLAEDRAETDREAEFIAQMSADSIADQFRKMTVMLEIFASSGWLDESDFAALHRRASASLFDENLHLIVLDESYDQILNTRVPFGSEIGATANAEAAEEVARALTTRVSSLFTGNVAQTEVFNVMRPEFVGDRQFILILTQNARDLYGAARSALPSNDWKVEIHDGAGGSIGQAGTALRGNGANPPCVLGGGTDGTVWAKALIEDSTWFVCVGRSGPDGVELQTYAFLGGGLLILSFGIGAAIVIGTIVRRDFQRAGLAARALSARSVVTGFTPRTREAQDILDALQDAHRDIMAKEDDQRLLLKEMEHRTRNLLGIAQSLAAMLAPSSSSVPDFVERYRSRIQSLAKSVSLLTSENWEGADLHQLIESVVATYVPEGEDRFSLSGDSLKVGSSATQNLALVINELGTNAAKYGAFAGESGTLDVAVSTDEERVTIAWTETGVPATAENNGEKGGFGSKLLDAMIEQHFGGQWTREFQPGSFLCRITLRRSRLH